MIFPMVMARLNFEHLKSFLTVVRTGSISRAAEQLCVTQPAISTRIRNLEESLSAQLFVRASVGLTLTKRGEMLLRYAEQFVQLAELIDRDVRDAKGVEGYLRLGVSDTIAQSWLPEFVQMLNVAYPQLGVEINVDISPVLRAALLQGEIDIAIMMGPVSETSIDNLPLPPFALGWYTAADTEVLEQDFPDLPIATYARHTRPYREMKAALFEQVGSTAKIFPSSSVTACFRLVEAGICVAALPKALAQDYVQCGTVKPFDPHWIPNALHFSVSYCGDPKSHLCATAAQYACVVAEEYNYKINL